MEVKINKDIRRVSRKHIFWTFNEAIYIFNTCLYSGSKVVFYIKAIFSELKHYLGYVF